MYKDKLKQANMSSEKRIRILTSCTIIDILQLNQHIQSTVGICIFSKSYGALNTPYSYLSTRKVMRAAIKSELSKQRSDISENQPYYDSRLRQTK